MSRQQSYYNQVYKEARALGYTDVQAKLAASQASLETGYGRSVKGNNHFGIKAGSKYTGKKISMRTHEEYGGKRVGITDTFRAYDGMRDSIRGYGEFMGKAFPDAWNAGDFSTAVRGLDKGRYGKYATDSKYKSKINYIGDRFGENVAPPKPPTLGPQLPIDPSQVARQGFGLPSLPPTIDDAPVQTAALGYFPSFASSNRPGIPPIDPAMVRSTGNIGLPSFSPAQRPNAPVTPSPVQQVSLPSQSNDPDLPMLPGAQDVFIAPDAYNRAVENAPAPTRAPRDTPTINRSYSAPGPSSRPNNRPQATPQPQRLSPSNPPDFVRESIPSTPQPFQGDVSRQFVPQQPTNFKEDVSRKWAATPPTAAPRVSTADRKGSQQIGTGPIQLAPAPVAPSIASAPKMAMPSGVPVPTMSPLKSVPQMSLGLPTPTQDPRKVAEAERKEKFRAGAGNLAGSAIGGLTFGPLGALAGGMLGERLGKGLGNINRGGGPDINLGGLLSGGDNWNGNRTIDPSQFGGRQFSGPVNTGMSNKSQYQATPNSGGFRGHDPVTNTTSYTNPNGVTTRFLSDGRQVSSRSDGSSTGAFGGFSDFVGGLFS